MITEKEYQEIVPGQMEASCFMHGCSVGYHHPDCAKSRHENKKNVREVADYLTCSGQEYLDNRDG